MKQKLPKQFFLYTVIGISSTIVQYITYVLILQGINSYDLANLGGFLLSVFNSFTWNQKFVFPCQAGEKRILWKALCKTYLMYSGTGVLLTSFLLHIFIENLGISRYIAPIIIVVIIYPLNFTISKVWAYKTEKKNGDS